MGQDIFCCSCFGYLCYLVPRPFRFARPLRWVGGRSEEEAHDLATRLLPLGFVVVHDAVGRGEHQVPELTGRQDVARQLLDVAEGDVEARGDHPALVDAADEVDHDLAGPVVVDDLDVAEVAVLLHHLQELHDDLGVRLGHHLALAPLLGVHDVVQAVAEDGDLHHLEVRGGAGGRCGVGGPSGLGP